MCNAINYNVIFLDEINFNDNDNDIYLLLKHNETFILYDFIITHKTCAVCTAVILSICRMYT
jgi:hypothetical protein